MGIAEARRDLNRRYVRRIAARQRRRNKSREPLTLSRHWSGSIQQFYHFLLGYFGPTATWVKRTGTTSLMVRDCGPMNVWFEAIRPDVLVEVVSAARALDVMVRDPERVHIVSGLDDPLEFRPAKLRSSAAAIKWLLDVENPVDQGDDRPQIVVIDRASTDDFYRGSESEISKSGSDRRSTPGLASAVDRIPLVGPSSVADTARMSPIDQLRLFSGASTIVGQHGAGLAHMLWLPAGSNVIEIVPPLVPGVDHIFKELAAALGHRYVAVAQASVHAPVDLEALRAGLAVAGLVR